MSRRHAHDDPDARLLRSFAAGEDSALSALAERRERDLLGLARGLLGGRRDLAEEVVQDVWMRVVRSANTWDGRASVRTWLYRITVNRCRDVGRIEHRHEAKARAARETARAAEALMPPPDSEGGALLRDAVASLDDARREVVLLCYHADLTHAQVADILEIPVGTVKSRLHAALSSLRADLATEVTP